MLGINETKSNREKKEIINPTKSWFFEKNHKIEKKMTDLWEQRCK